jgi:hypothetical protein
MSAVDFTQMRTPLALAMDKQADVRYVMKQMPELDVDAVISAIRKKVHDKGADTMTLMTHFRKFEPTEGDGHIDPKQMHHIILSHYGMNLTKSQLRKLFDRLDADRGGTVDKLEFVRFFGCGAKEEVRQRRRAERGCRASAARQAEAKALRERRPGALMNASFRPASTDELAGHIRSKFALRSRTDKDVIRKMVDAFRKYSSAMSPDGSTETDMCNQQLQVRACACSCCV